MSHHGRRAGRILSFGWFAKPWDRGHRAGSTSGRRRRRTGLWAGPDTLETRTLLSVSAVVGPMPDLETLNVQFQPGVGGDLSRWTSLITAAGATIQPTLIAELYQIRGPVPDMGQLAQVLSVDPAVQYAEPMQMVHAAVLPNDPQFTA